MNNRIVNNTISLYAMNIAKMVLPLITLPYLTRVLSKDCYGVVSFVKATMQYMQLIIDFGFLLSGTKAIVKARETKEELEIETGNILIARILLGLLAGIILLILTPFIEILREYFLYTTLSFVAVFLTCFLFDYLFRGLEKMHIITIRFVVMKAISAVLTFVLVRSDADLFLIPVLDIVGTLIAIVLVLVEIKKLNIKIKCTGLKQVFDKIKESAVYFISEFATTAFGALNTIVIGIYATKSQIADWSLCMQLVTAVQSMYTPITNGIYPEMVKSKNFNIIKKTLKIFVPLIACGCIFTFFVAKYALVIVGGAQYASAAPVLRSLIPVMFFGFLSMMFGWPTLGAIGKERATTKTTVISALVQIVAMLTLIPINKFALVNIALTRGLTEMLMFLLRYRYYNIYKKEFVNL